MPASPAPHTKIQTDFNLKRELIKQISQPTDRDKQWRVGPSGLGNACAYCLGNMLAGKQEDRDFSLYPWIGTGMHKYLELTTFPNFEHELRLYCGEVSGYGKIYGTTDMYIPHNGGIVDDWKFVGIKKIKNYIVNGAPDNYRYQAMLYGKGAVLSGRSVGEIAITFFPRDSPNPNDIFVYKEPYNEQMADDALTRAGILYNDYVLLDAIDELPVDKNCYNCNGMY